MLGRLLYKSLVRERASIGFIAFLAFHIFLLLPFVDFVLKANGVLPQDVLLSLRTKSFPIPVIPETNHSWLFSWMLFDFAYVSDLSNWLLLFCFDIFLLSISGLFPQRLHL
jgi:hypothetical protein